MIISDKERETLKNTFRLPERQLMILELMMEGCDSNKELSERVKTTLPMIKLELHYMYQTMGVSSKTQAVASAFRSLLKSCHS